jgi:hypothetical protein
MPKSKLSNALSKLGFATKNIYQERDIQMAFLENLYFAGSFKDEKIWQEINLMDYDTDGKKQDRKWTKDYEIIFLILRKTLDDCAANQGDPKKFNAERLLDNLFEEGIFDDQDVEDFIIHTTQCSFARTKGQERDALKQKDWMDNCQAKYLQNARKIGLIAELKPKQKKYDEAWIQGATRPTMISRMKYLKSHGVEIDTLRLFTGERELRIPFDKTKDESADDAEKFMIELAAENGIKIGDPKFIKYDEKNRRLNYAEGETRRLTETMAAKKIYREIFGKEIDEQDIVDSKSGADKSRPTTITNARDIAKCDDFRRKLEGREDFKVAIISSQPYAERQKISIEREVIKNLPDSKISFEAIGGECVAPISVIDSEMACFVSENFRTETCAHKSGRKRTEKQLTFSTRCNDSTVVSTMPERAVGKVFGSSGAAMSSSDTRLIAY